MGMFKSRAELRAEDAAVFAANAIDRANLVLGRERPGWKGAIRTYGLGAFDFGLERFDQRLSAKFGQVEAGCDRLAMNAGDERCDGVTIGSGEVTKIGWCKQRDIALLGILPRLQASATDAVQAGARFDTSEKIDDVCCLSTHC
jgi:hypothetical protein